MPVGMNSLATVLTMREYRYSFAAAGAVVGVYLAGLAAVSPFAGRLMDRAGLARVLIPCAVGYASGIGLLLVLASRHAPLAALITGAVFAAGFPFALVYGTVGSLVSVISPAGSGAEAFSVIASAMAAGGALGVVAAGFAASRGGPAASLGTTACFAAVALVTTVPPVQRWCGLGSA
jgi:MFS family permease